MSSFTTSVQSWLAQTSTKGAIVYLATLASQVLAHQMTKDAALSAAIPAVVGLLFNDAQIVSQVSSVVTPVVQAVADKPTLASVQAAVVAEEPKLVAAIPSATSEALSLVPTAATVLPKPVA